MRSFLLAAVWLIFGLGATMLVAEALQTSRTQKLDTVADTVSPGASPQLRISDPATNRRSSPAPATQPMAKSQ